MGRCLQPVSVPLSTTITRHALNGEFSYDLCNRNVLLPSLNLLVTCFLSVLRFPPNPDAVTGVNYKMNTTIKNYT